MRAGGGARGARSTDATTRRSRERDDPGGASRERDSRRAFEDFAFENVTLTKRKRLSSARCRWRSPRVPAFGRARETPRDFRREGRALGAEMATDAELKTVLEIKGGTSQRFEMSKQDPDPTGSYRFVAVTSDTVARGGSTLETPKESAVVAVCPEWAVKRITSARARTLDISPSAAAGRAPPRAAEGEHAYAGAPRGSSIAERRRAALEKTAEAEARRAADSAAAAARPRPARPGRRDGVVRGGGRGCRVSARRLRRRRRRARAPPSWLAIPDSESPGAPVPGRVKERLVCQKPTSTALLVRGSAGPFDRRARFGRRTRATRRRAGGDASAEEAGDGTKTLTADQDVPRPPGGFNARLIEPLLELADIYETVLAGTDKYKAKHHKTVAKRCGAGLRGD